MAKIQNNIPARIDTSTAPLVQPKQSGASSTAVAGSTANPKGLANLVGAQRSGFRGVFSPDRSRLSIRGLPTGLSLPEVLGRLGEHDPSNGLLTAALDVLQA